ncbi:amidohydrolase, partial [Candidatus Bathyarchaeota archaeon]|nr:amidohydrolase [Candidatus Bathyarchaeota archaeon]
MEIKADMVLINGKVITVDHDDSVVEAVAIRGNLIEAVGTTKEIKTLVGPETKVIDLQG